MLGVRGQGIAEHDASFGVVHRVLHIQNPRHDLAVAPNGVAHVLFGGNLDGDGYYVREGIVIVPKNAVVKDGTTI